MHPLLEELEQLNISLEQAKGQFRETTTSDLPLDKKVEEIVTVMKIAIYAGDRAMEIQKQIEEWSEEDLQIAQMNTRTLNG